ncbi:hypothetical protein RINTHH_6370 [Richelia intracellularis HH01]|uniref:Uncharacterized protein n=1 Tax=Richelia intracellularis HH01 TaxID=1165094 RepID=M1WYD2_9NOST|nr:hypothetical protein RINTHH_6370 [Richelia intracellularis HH01]
MEININMYGVTVESKARQWEIQTVNDKLTSTGDYWVKGDYL